MNKFVVKAVLFPRGHHGLYKLPPFHKMLIKSFDSDLKGKDREQKTTNSRVKELFDIHFIVKMCFGMSAARPFSNTSLS